MEQAEADPSPEHLEYLCQNFFSNLTLDLELDNATYCPPIWDSVRCWPPASAPSFSTVNCWDVFRGRFGESHVARLSHLEDALRVATVRKYCGPAGEWDPRNYTDYSVCSAVLGSDYQSFQYRGAVVAWISFLTALISLVFVSVGLAIICCFRSLTCTRMKLHKNLMIALAMRYILDLIMFEASVTGRSGPTYTNLEWLCKSVGALRLYTTISIFLWMFNEGYHLHSRIATSIFNRKEHNKRFHFIGWVLPAPLVVLWAVMMTRDPRFTSGNCFAGVKKSPWIWLVVGPVTLALLGNVFFLINIIRILVQRYRRQNMREVATVRRAVKATILLLPLLGVTNVLFFFNPEDNGPYEMAYLIANSSLQGTFGVFVTIFYCFADHQARKALYSKCIRAGGLGCPQRHLWSLVYHLLCLRTEVGRGGDSVRVSRAGGGGGGGAGVSGQGGGSLRQEYLLRRDGTGGSAGTAGSSQRRLIHGGSGGSSGMLMGSRRLSTATQHQIIDGAKVMMGGESGLTSSRPSTAGLIRDDEVTCLTPIRMSPTPNSPILLTGSNCLNRNTANGCRRQSAVDFCVSFAYPTTAPRSAGLTTTTTAPGPEFGAGKPSSRSPSPTAIRHCASSPRLLVRTGTYCNSSRGGNNNDDNKQSGRGSRRGKKSRSSPSSGVTNVVRSEALLPHRKTSRTANNNNNNNSNGTQEGSHLRRTLSLFQRANSRKGRNNNNKDGADKPNENQNDTYANIKAAACSGSRVFTAITNAESCAGKPAPGEIPAAATDASVGSSSTRGTNMLNNAREWLGSKTRQSFRHLREKRQTSSSSNKENEGAPKPEGLVCIAADDSDVASRNPQTSAPRRLGGNGDESRGGDKLGRGSDLEGGKGDQLVSDPPATSAADVTDVDDPTRLPSRRARALDGGPETDEQRDEDPRSETGAGADQRTKVGGSRAPRILIGADEPPCADAGRVRSSFDFSEEGVNAVLVLGGVSGGGEDDDDDGEASSTATETGAAFFLSAASAAGVARDGDGDGDSRSSFDGTALTHSSPGSTSPLLFVGGRRPRQMSDSVLRVEDPDEFLGAQERKTDETFV